MTDSRPRVAVVTGAAQGLGAEIAARLAEDGYALGLIDIHADGLARTKSWIDTAIPGAAVVTAQADLAHEAAVRDAFAVIDGAFGRVDGLVNTAGGSGTEQLRDIEDLSEQAWSRVIGNNLTSTFLCCKYAVALMRRNGHGRIVNFSSAVANGLSGPSGTVGARLPYASSKAAINGFTRQLAKDLAAEGITVNAISPGLILPTVGRVRDVFDRLAQSDQAAIRAAIPVGRPGTGAEIASAVAYLLAEDSGFTSGAILSVDGAAS